MKEALGNLWDFHNLGYPVCVTTNNTLTRKKEIIMGGGCALEAKERFPKLPKELAIALTANYKLEEPVNLPMYFNQYNLITFPTKYNVRDKSDIELIAESCKALMEIIKANGFGKVYLPRPGVGLGGLNWEHVVKPVISNILGDEVIVITNE